MTTLDILMDFLWKFEGNSHSIDRKFTQERHKMGKLTFKVIDKSPNGKSGLNIAEAKTNFSSLVKKAKMGEEIISANRARKAEGAYASFR